MAITQLDTETTTPDITSIATVLTHTPSASEHTQCQGFLSLSGLDASGGMFELTVSVGGVAIQPDPQIVSFAATATGAVFTAPFPVPANTAVLLRIKSPNAGDSAGVTCVAYLYTTAAGTDGANTTVPDAAGTAPTTGEIKTAIEAAGSHLTLIKAVTDALTSAAATKIALSAGTMVTGTVSHDNTAATTTVFYSDDITEATADHFKNRIVIFTSGALQYQAKDITAYSLVSGEGKFTVSTLTESPADNVTFIII